MFLKNLLGSKDRLTDINATDEVNSWVTFYKDKFIEWYYYEFLEDDEEGAEIFEEARELLMSFSEKALLKQMRKYRVNTDLITLNVIHNVAMVTVQNGSVTDVISKKGKTQSGVDVYEFINRKKLELHYISPKQYAENSKIIEHIRCSLF